MSRMDTRRLVLAGILAALVFVVTSFTMVKVPFVIVKQAYFHAGDSIIYLSGFVLGWYVAAVVSGIGSFLADLYLGASQYMFATLIIKAIMGAIAGYLLYVPGRRPSLKRKVLGLVLAGIWMAFAYYLYEVMFLGINPIANLPNLVANLGQAGVGIVIFIPLSHSIERLKRFS